MTLWNLIRHDPAGPDSEDGDDVQHVHDDEHNTSSFYLAVDSATATEVAELDAIALLADTWDVDLGSDPAVSAQLFQAHAQAYLSFGSGKRKVKSKGKAKGKYPVCPITTITRRPASTSEGTESEDRMPDLRP